MSTTTDPVKAPEAVRESLLPVLGRKILPVVWRFFSGALALGLLVGVVIFGQRSNWKMPKFAALIGQGTAPGDDWCAEHAVPETICVECGGGKARFFGWCKTHGVHECPLCHPEVAQVNTPNPDPTALVAHFEKVDAVGERLGNSPKCKLHERRLQFASAEAARMADVRVEPVAASPIFESVQAPGEVEYDPKTVARIASLLPGTVRRVEKGPGDRVKRGDILALVDAPAVGKARADLTRAQVRVEVEAKNLATLQALVASVPERRIRDARAALDEATIERLAAEQTLANLGLSGAATLMPIVAPRDGVLLQRNTNVGEVIEAGTVLFLVAEPNHLRLTLQVRVEEIGRLKLGLPVRFTAEGRAASGPIVWIGTALEEKTRCVPVRVALEQRDPEVRAGLYGTGVIILREAGSAVIVPGEAVHWEGCCHVVFVRDRNYTDPAAAKVFHVRKVQPGVAEPTRVEILAGLLPGEVIATAGSGLLRGELLRNNLGAG